jgi:hypothetical protein
MVTFVVFGTGYTVSAYVSCDQIIITSLRLAALIISGELCKLEIPVLCNVLPVLFCN